MSNHDSYSDTGSPRTVCKDRYPSIWPFVLSVVVLPDAFLFLTAALS